MLCRIWSTIQWKQYCLALDSDLHASAHTGTTCLHQDLYEGTTNIFQWYFSGGLKSNGLGWINMVREISLLHKKTQTNVTESQQHQIPHLWCMQTKQPMPSEPVVGIGAGTAQHILVLVHCHWLKKDNYAVRHLRMGSHKKSVWNNIQCRILFQTCKLHYRHNKEGFLLQS